MIHKISLPQTKAVQESSIHKKITLFFLIGIVSLVASLVTISFYEFNRLNFSLASQNIQTVGEIIRVHLTESMVNGTIDKREAFFEHLKSEHNLTEIEVKRSNKVIEQFGKGNLFEQKPDELEAVVLYTGKPIFQRITNAKDSEIIRGVIPYLAFPHKGNQDCMLCHNVKQGDVLGTISVTMDIDKMVSTTQKTILVITSSVVFLMLSMLFFANKFLSKPLSQIANEITEAVKNALKGNFKTQISSYPNDELGKIAQQLNDLFTFLHSGLTHIEHQTWLLTHQNSAIGNSDNLLTSTLEQVNALVSISNFKQAIAEDETKRDVYIRLANTLRNEFGICEGSIYELSDDKRRLEPILIRGNRIIQQDCVFDSDGFDDDDDNITVPPNEKVKHNGSSTIVSWCNPAALENPQMCRLVRTGHSIDGLHNTTICPTFQPTCDSYRGNKRSTHCMKNCTHKHYLCLPIFRSTGLAAVVQIIVSKDKIAELQCKRPLIEIYLKEMQPVIESKHLLENLKNATLHDTLTKLKNRRFLEEYLEILHTNMLRSKVRMTILSMDVDYFKNVNDTYGHNAGDLVLKHVADILQKSVRKTDFVIRTGGEEFLVLLINTPLENGLLIAERIRLSMEKSSIQVNVSTTLRKTISIGAVEYPKTFENLDFWEAVKYSDIALYQAKKTGRNKVMAYSEENPDNAEAENEIQKG